MKEYRRNNHEPKFDRKSAQLCKQVQQTLEYLLGDILCDIDAIVNVADVQPAPFTSHLLVILQVSGATTRESLFNVEKVVQRKASYLREEIAHTIHRKKAPTLSFHVIPL